MREDSRRRRFRLLSTRDARRRFLLYLVAPIAIVLLSVLLATRVLDIAQPPDDPHHDVGIDFKVDGYKTLGPYAQFMWGAALAHIPARQGEVESSVAMSVSVGGQGCSTPTTVKGRIDLDPRWLLAVRATRLHHRLILRSSYLPGGKTFIIDSPNVPGRFAFGISGKVSAFRAQLEDTGVHVPVRTTTAEGGTSPDISIVTGRIPDGEFATRHLFSDLSGDTLTFQFRAPWLWSRGFESCYLSLPRLVNDQYVSGLPVYPPDLAVLRPDGTGTGQTAVDVTDGAVDLQDTTPAPNSAGASRTWNCARGDSSANPLVPLPDCHAIVVVTAPNQSADLQLRIIILAALISGGLVAIGAELRRLVTHRWK